MKDTLRPLIGVSTRLETGKDNFYLRRYYAEAILAAGGLPIYLPLLPDREFLSEVGARLSGILLSGSDSDLDPSLYGEEPHPRLGPVVPERDSTDLLLLELAEERRWPVLGICFGLQSLNVARGGSLVQDIEAMIPGALQHEQGQPYDRASHGIRIEEDSLLAELARDASARVNSTHHQAIGRLGRDLQAVAWAADGVIEAVVDQRPDRYTLGVQWHPELNYRQDQFSRAIFASLIEAARARDERER